MKCNSDGSYEAIFTDTAVDPYSPLYQDRDKNNNVYEPEMSYLVHSIFIVLKSCWTSGCECPGQCIYEHNGVSECVQCTPDQSFAERTCLAAAEDAISCPENQIVRRE